MIDNGWNVHQKLVLTEISDLKKGQEELKLACQEKLTQILIDIAALKVKSGIWGLIGGLIPVGIFVGYMLLRQ